MKQNNWVWTDLAESLIPDRKAGTTVPVQCLLEGYDEYRPYQAWIKSGYVRNIVYTPNLLEDTKHD